MMTKEKLTSNIAGIQKSISKFIKFGDGKTDAIMVDNYDWGQGLNWLELLREVGPHISVNRMLTMDSVKIRLEKEEHLSFLEFNYMIMQAYDFYHLYKTYNCTLQLCGADQWGNVVAGVDLARRMQFVNNLPAQEIYGLSTPLLTDKSGKKIGKSAGNAVWLNEDLLNPYEYFQYFRNIADDDIELFLKVYTDFSLEEVAKIANGDPNEAKRILAFETTKMCHGEEEAERASKQAEDIFKHNTIDSLPKLDYKADEKSVSQMLKNLDFAPSVGEAKKLIRGGGVRIDDEKVEDENLDVSGLGQFKLSVGKKKHFLIAIK
jgi:tyrosyl-tRNA synthetase